MVIIDDDVGGEDLMPAPGLKLIRGGKTQVMMRWRKQEEDQGCEDYILRALCKFVRVSG